MPVEISKPRLDAAYQVFIPCAVAWRLIEKLASHEGVSTGVASGAARSWALEASGPPDCSGSWKPAPRSSSTPERRGDAKANPIGRRISNQPIPLLLDMIQSSLLQPSLRLPTGSLLAQQELAYHLGPVIRCGDPEITTAPG
jgi:hypothetical protein